MINQKTPQIGFGDSKKISCEFEDVDRYRTVKLFK